MLKENIKLPDYQRYFVWDEKRSLTLIESLRKEQYVPPVTIGAFTKDNQNQNLILDGQQRLTSVLLSYLNYFPDKESFKKHIELSQDENDFEEENEENILYWTFTELVKKGKTRESIIKELTKPSYKELNFNVDEKFFENTYLGFTYLIPGSKDEKYQQEYFSSTFRSINIQGITLLPQESRAALYYLDKDKVEYFEPKFLTKLKNRIDFVRYLSLLSEYNNNGDANSLARGCRSKMEKYYEDYIYATINNSTSSIFAQFKSLFSNGQFDKELAALEKYVSVIDIEKRNSIIDLDIIYFGLIYKVLFEKKNIDLSKKDSLLQKINDCIKELREDYYHARSPGALKYLRQRVDTSIEVYSAYEE